MAACPACVTGRVTLGAAHVGGNDRGSAIGSSRRALRAGLVTNPLKKRVESGANSNDAYRSVICLPPETPSHARIVAGLCRFRPWETSRRNTGSAVYNRLAIAPNCEIRPFSEAGFQDHRHRPLGHPSASKVRRNSRVLIGIRARPGPVSPEVSPPAAYRVSRPPAIVALTALSGRSGYARCIAIHSLPFRPARRSRSRKYPGGDGKTLAALGGPGCITVPIRRPK